MADAETALRDRLMQVGLARHADALLELSVPAIRLHGEREPSGQRLGRPPAAVWGLGGGVTAVAGGHHKLALRDDGTVAAWGENGAGQLGDGTRKHRRSAVQVRDAADVIAIAVGQGHSLALTSAGGVLAWGLNQWGALGDGTRTNRHTPVPVQGLERGVIAIAAGENVSLALTSDGSVFGWGLNPLLAPGDAHAAPIRCPGLEGIIAIAAGGTERLALTAEGTVVAWGSSPSDLSGTGRCLGPARWGSAPGPVDGVPTAVVAIASGNAHSLALTTAGAVFAWGQGHLGALGDGTGENRYPPVQVSGLGEGVRAIAAGYGCSYAVTNDGAVLAWGWNHDGRLGDGSPTEQANGTAPVRLAPAPVPALRGSVAALSEFLALMDDGSVCAWGGEYQPDEHGADARLDLAATKLGGRPDLRHRSRWPSRDGQALPFVAQIDLAQVAPLDRHGLLPRAGLLSFFRGDPSGPLEPDVCAVVFNEPGSPLSRREFPDELPDHQRYRAIALKPEADLTLPPEPPPFLTEDERDTYQWKLVEELTPRPRHRILGHPDPVQRDPRADSDAVVLLQIDSDDGAQMTWGDVGRVYFLIPLDDLRRKAFEASRCELQSH